jgi:2-hydroxychromene-2-carboxylate isomerase
MPSPSVTLFYSFRSPYSWLGFHRARRALPALDVELRCVPVFPPPGMVTASTSTPQRLAYTLEDSARVAAAYGLTVRWPEEVDVDWVRPHACAYWAAEAGRGEDFIAAAFAARFERAQDLGAAAVLRGVAAEIGLDGDACVTATGDPQRHRQVWQGMAEAQASGVFGVPTFVFAGKMFWGNDRLEWLVRAIAQTRGRAVPDLAADPLGPVCAREP